MGSQSKMKEFRRQNALSIIEENPASENYETTETNPETALSPRRKNSVKRNAVALKSAELENALCGCQILHHELENKRNAQVLSLSEFNNDDLDKRESECEENLDIDKEESDNETCSSGHGSEDEGNDLGALKQQATKLKLKTRRSSYVTWRTQCLVKSGTLMKPRLTIQNDAMKYCDKENNADEILTDDRREKINNSLIWIRNELHEMRVQDQTLARQLLNLRQDIQSLRLKWSCEDHQEMLEDMQYDLEERQILHSICDLPLDPLDFQHSNPLKQLGVTRMNLHARRFSTC